MKSGAVLIEFCVDPGMGELLNECLQSRPTAMLYIDPGTGSMLFAILIGIIGAANYGLRIAWVKLRFLLSGRKGKTGAEDVIPFAIFSDDKRYWSIFEPICRDFDRRGVDIVYFTASADDPVFQAPYSHLKAEFVGEGNKAFIKLNFLKAVILLSTTPGLDVYQWKRSPEVKYYVHILHAPGEILLYRMFGIDYYDAILLAGKFQFDDVRALEKLRNLPAKDLYMTGIPYMDEMVKRFRSAGAVPEHERTVLLAPSWGPSAMFSVFGGQVIEALLATGYHIVVRPHPQSFKTETALMDELMAKYPASEQLEWNRDTDNFEVLRRADILISDFSGVTFEFALVYDKPIIYTNAEFDTAVYDAWWLEKELWVNIALPRLGMQLTEEKLGTLKDMIDECISSKEYTEGRQAVRNECWGCYGEGTKKTVDCLVAKYEELIAAEASEK